MSQMSIAEGLNELKRINSTLELRYQNIRDYCSKRHNSKDKIEHQAEFVKSEEKSARDLLDRYTRIKMAINKSNLTTILQYKTYNLSVAEAILFKNYIAEQENKLLEQFTDRIAKQEIDDHRYALSVTSQKLDSAQLMALDLVPELYYEPKRILMEREKIIDFLGKVDFLIDASNHKTMITVD